jgi:TPR repeat protein
VTNLDGTKKMTSPIDWDQEPDLAALRHAIDVKRVNPLEGEVLLRRLVEKGSVQSMVHLGYLYAYRVEDSGGPDLREAERWYRRACEAGSVEAGFHLGRFYLKTKSNDQAREAFEIGARRGYAPCLFHLGRMYRDGLSVESQFDRAREMFERAASLDHIYAKRALGRLLLSGRFGFLGRLKGLRLVLAAAIDATKEIQKNPDSERLKM